MNVKLIVVSMLSLVLSLPALALAAGPGAHFFDCKECHLSGLTVLELQGGVGGNVCLKCHDTDGAHTTAMNAGNPQGYDTTPIKSAGQFSAGDASNQYGNNPTPGAQSSHNWAATSVNRAAGASNPNRTLHKFMYGYRGRNSATVNCARCHNPHAAYSASNPKLLPMKNDGVTPMAENDMCLACHSDFNIGSGSHGFLSHPIGMLYSQVVTDNPGKYIANPEAGLNAGDLTLMSDGTISCVTCHGVHKTDSDATTTDGFGGTAGAGDGLLLKANGPAIEALDPSAGKGICQACHIYEGHAAGVASGNDMGCMVCHGGHAYDADAPNYYMLNKEVTTYIPKLGAVGTVTLDYDVDPTTVPHFSNGGVNGALCISCHDLPASHNPGDACADCHNHDASTGSFGAGCGSCHGYAPSVNDRGDQVSGGYAFDTGTGFNYPASTSFKSELTTPHANHANGADYSFACANCHGDGSGNLNDGPGDGDHNGGTFQQVLDTAIPSGVASLPALPKTGGMIPVYNEGGTGSCDAVYCHSNGRVARGGVVPTQSAAVGPWDGGANTINDCTSCHNIGGAGDSATHDIHLAKGYSCAICHLDTATNATNLAAGAIGTTHVNGVLDVKGSGLAVTSGAVVYDDTTGNCATYCHSNGKGAAVTAPDWDDANTGNCGDCHGGSSAAGADSIIASGSHTEHLSAGLSCDDCHGAGAETGTHAGHIDGDGPNNYDFAGGFTCNTCHGATATVTTGPDRMPIWGNSASVDCETCHAGSAIATISAKTAPNKTVALSKGHGLTSGSYAVTNNFAANKGCTECHDAAAAGHFDASGDKRLVGGFACLMCHDGSVATQVATHTNIGATIKTEDDFTKECLECHDPHGDAVNAAMINVAGVVFTARTGLNSFDEVDTANADDICATCHTTTSHNNSAATGSHGANEGADCVTCHGHDVGFMPTGGNSCEECHGVKLAQPRHAAHIDITTSVENDLTECAICHPSAAAYTIAGGSVDHFNNSGNDFAPGITSPEGATTTCSSAMGCHLSSAADGSWQDLDGLNCNACHFQAADPTQAANTSDANTISAGHNAHFAAGGAVVCNDCHAAVTDTTHITGVGADDAARLTDKANAVQDEGDVVVTGTFDDGANTCSTTVCHNDARPGVAKVTPAWGTDVANCTQCHLASPTSGSHGVHILDAADCSDCHTSASEDTSYNSTNHLDSNIDVSAGGYPNNRAQNSTFTNCSNASCHNDGRNGGLTPTWGTTVNNCAECHATSPVTGSHASHLADADVDCGDCHTGAFEGTTAPTANHRSGSVNAVGYPVQGLGATYQNCSNASCHNDGRNGGTTQNWGTTVNDCGECHATEPGTGGHDAHVGVSFAGSLISCGDCHTNAVSGTTAPSANHRDGNVNAVGYPVQVNGSTFKTCTTASCHRAGQDTVAANDYTETPVWDANTANCTQCHEATPTTGSHTEHFPVTSGSCTGCHTNAAAGVSYVDAAHGDGDVDVALGGYTANKAYGAAEESCASISCHSDGYTGPASDTPVWGIPSGCAACHLDDMTRGSHSAHLADNNNCGTCHGDTVKSVSAPTGVHANTNVDVYDVVAGDLGYPTTAAYGPGSWSTCSAASCHDAGREANLTSTWGTTISDCTECHSAAAINTGSHAVHIADGATCASCHDAATDPATETAPASGHRDTNIDVTAGTYPTNKAKGSAFSNCTTASCHDDGRGSATTGTWGTPRANCGECHAVAPTTGSHTSHLADATTDCGDCHTGAFEGSAAPTNNHRDGNTNAVGYPVTTNGGAFTNCSTATCHDTGRNSSGLTGVWGTPKNNCSECHETVPTTGSHTRHLAHFACATCHTGATQGSVAGGGHRDGDIDTAAATGLTANKPNGDAFVSCGTNNCHGSGSPVWGTNLSAVDQCTKCHGQQVAGPATASQKAPGGLGVDTNGDSLATDAQVGAHQIHLNPTKSKPVACAACHVVPATVTSAGHIDSALPAELTWGSTALANSTTPTSCGTTYCHSDSAIGKGFGGAEVITETWNDTSYLVGDVTDCNNCHGYPPAGSHSTNPDCDTCHFNVNPDNISFVDNSIHVDGVVQADGGNNCTDCHSGDIDAGLSGVHDSHTDTTAFLVGKQLDAGDYGGTGWYSTTYVNGEPVFGCGQCHPAAEGTGHPINGLNVDIDPAGETPGAGNIKLLNAAQSTPTMISRSSVTCASVYCHSDAAGSFKTTLNWYGGALPTDGTECAACHGNSPTTAAHGAHEVGIHYEELYDDDGVGLMAVDPTQTGASGGTDSAHGNAATSSTINCYTCHSGTVTDSANALNTTCINCHSDTNSIITGNEIARISTTSSTHINGVKDVVFSDLTVFKSKAQLRDNLSDAVDGGNILSSIWNRITGYKAATGYDTAQAAFGTPLFTQGPDTCSTVACHNGNTATWSDAAVDCMYCHTSLPK